MSGTGHIPVLLEEVKGFLEIQREGIYIDCTVGLGGHSIEILKTNPKARVIGFDIDEKSLLLAKEKLHPYADRLSLYHSDFRYIPDLNLKFSEIRGILIDLGMSSYQLDSQERGFSFQHDGPLDMRMDQRNKITASKIINKYSEMKLAQIFWDYGELRASRKLAHEIISRRKINKIETTKELLEVVEAVCQWRPRKGKSHPAALVFQSLRIEVNQELKNLSNFLERFILKCPKKTRIVVISFHSLEDRIVKQTFARLAVQNNHPATIKKLTKKPVTASEEEVVSNFRARSAKLRAAERI
ncbi:16S rRNA (cytosine(1402)-N(4))-methyltransferase RsmH [Acidobacteriota bacterium]